MPLPSPRTPLWLWLQILGGSLGLGESDGQKPRGCLARPSTPAPAQPLTSTLPPTPYNPSPRGALLGWVALSATPGCWDRGRSHQPGLCPSLPQITASLGNCICPLSRSFSLLLPWGDVVTMASLFRLSRSPGCKLTPRAHRQGEHGVGDRLHLWVAGLPCPSAQGVRTGPGQLLGTQPGPAENTGSGGGREGLALRLLQDLRPST